MPGRPLAATARRAVGDQAGRSRRRRAARGSAVAQLFPPAPPLGVPGDEGLFGPASAAWRVGRERLLLAGGPAALLLQVAHPLVATAVAEHSQFGQDPLRRLRGPSTRL